MKKKAIEQSAARRERALKQWVNRREKGYKNLVDQGGGVISKS